MGGSDLWSNTNWATWQWVSTLFSLCTDHVWDRRQWLGTLLSLCPDHIWDRWQWVSTLLNLCTNDIWDNWQWACTLLSLRTDHIWDRWQWVSTLLSLGTIHIWDRWDWVSTLFSFCTDHIWDIWQWVSICLALSLATPGKFGSEWVSEWVLCSTSALVTPGTYGRGTTLMETSPKHRQHGDFTLTWRLIWQYSIHCTITETYFRCKFFSLSHTQIYIIVFWVHLPWYNKNYIQTLLPVQNIWW